MRSKKSLITIALALFFSLILIAEISFMGKPNISPKGESIAVQQIDTQISADGKVASQNEAKLQFQTSGKLTYLPFKEGDTVKRGQTVASLDTYAIQRQMTIALNNYRSTRDTFDQVQNNSGTGVLQGQQKYSLDVTNRAGISGQGEVDIINDMAKRIVDQNQATLDNSVAQVELVNYSLQLATLTSPIDGIITHQDVTVPNVNVTPATMFTIDDPESIVFRSQVNEQDIDFVSEGSTAVIHINGYSERTFSGTVVKIHPEKVTLPTGQSIYQVDIQSDDLNNSVQFGQAGFAQIASNTAASTQLVPAWTVLNQQYIWVESNGKKVLKSVKVGKTHGSYTEVISGLDSTDKVIINPASVVSDKYTLL
jgi:multidrug efflux pump subunit AcrA (membrane-fusion protein)